MKNKKGISLVTGEPWKAIILFAIPLLGSSLIQLLYSTVDLIFVGRFIGTDASAAVGASDLLVTLLIGLFTGISVGSGVVAAQLWGAKDRKKLHTLIQSVFTLGLIGAVVLVILGFLLAGTALRLINAPEDVLPKAIVYLRIYFLSLFSIVLYNLCSGIIRALGDSAATLRFQIFGAVFNVFSDFMLIVVIPLGVAGAAIATFISQTVAALLTLRYLHKLDSDIALKFKELQIDFALIKKVLSIGIPSGLQSMIMTFSNIVVQTFINGLGVVTIASFTVYFKLELFVWYPEVAIGQALVTYTAQNYGANQHDRIKKGIKSVLIFGVPFTMVLAGLILLFARPLFSVFNPDPAVIETGLKIVFTTLPFYFCYTFMETFSAAVKGKGRAVATTIITISTICAARVALLYIYTSIVDDVRSIAAVYPSSWFLAAIGMIVLYFIDKKRHPVQSERTL